MGGQQAGWTEKLVWTPCVLHLFVTHITTLPVLQIILRQIEGYLINGDLERTWMEATVAYFKVLGLILPRRNEEKLLHLK
jgi:hypothetical protein